MKDHKKKMIAPVVITLIIVLYYVGIAAVFLLVDGMPALVKCC